MKNLVTSLSHLLISSEIKDKIIVDATLGNGLDSAYIATLAKHVYAFDIQDIAIERSRQTLKDFANITYICDSHENIFNYVTNASGYFFNLGYLPGSTKNITTLATSTLGALNEIYVHLKTNDFILLVVYLGHPEGLNEEKEILKFLDSIDTRSLDIIKVTLECKVKKAPWILFIKKTK